MLQTDGMDEEKIKRALQTIERSAKLQAQLIEDLVDFSRITSGKLRINMKPIDPHSFTEAAIEVVRPAADARGIKLQPVLDAKIGCVSGDADRLQQVMWNLLSNAIKFTPQGGQVQVRTKRIHSQVEIIVSDTGQGISPEFLPYVFERFQQANNTATQRQGGLGLGMAITRQILELHGGTIRADSAGEGQGATFTVKLPLVLTANSESISLIG